ncbi:hypothetical protein D9619_002601 [Psilocybe cf. subviscida]|uniref:UNC-45/Cro1/She4 central domain-containing protein n=1 Tax=Psilocybe cf. subviscida TaxID=2480587 RepID=A0A8H5ETT1_9AGAR|nr:hypothetical protein D9619_002601 [Psilocybe cf. subviscida]
MATNDASDKLNQILKKTQSLSDSNLLPDEIAFLTSIFSPGRDDASTIRSKAYVVLSAYCQAARNIKGKAKTQLNDEDEGTVSIARTFGSSISERLNETNEDAILCGVSFLAALFQIDSKAASVIFAEDGLVENVMDTVDLSPSALLSQEVAHLLGQAAGVKVCRAVITPQIVRWLEFKSHQQADIPSRSAAAVALIKLAKGSAADSPENGSPEVGEQTNDLVETMVDIIVQGNANSVVDAAEGLAYLSTDPSVKESLAKNPSFLRNLFDLVPKSKTSAKDVNPTLVYGVMVIVTNLLSFRPRLSAEQQQMEKLKKMAKAGNGKGQEDSASAQLDDDDHVKVRIRLLVTAGVLSAFAGAISSTDSPGIRASVGKSLLSICEEKENRGQVLQTGGSKLLQTSIRQSLSTQPEGAKNKTVNLSATDLEAIQALTKLAITSSPVQVFGPNVGTVYDAIRPFSILVQHPSSTLLQRFEGIMALTNLASYTAETASRIAKSDGLLDHVELLLLEEHTLVRRASVELICNLIAGSDDTFERYSGTTPSSASKIHILLALSDLEDTATRLAASGALATLTAAPAACAALVALQFEKDHFLREMTQLIDPSCLPDTAASDDEPVLDTNPGLVHRGVVCIANVFQSITDSETRAKMLKGATEAGVIQALFRLVKGEGLVKDQAIVAPAAEALKSIMTKT